MCVWGGGGGRQREHPLSLSLLTQLRIRRTADSEGKQDETGRVRGWL